MSAPSVRVLGLGVLLAAALPCTAAVEVLRDGTAHEALFAVQLSQRTGVAVGAAGAVFESADGGASWTAATAPPTRLALLGVDVDGDRALAVGQQGLVMLRDGSGWRQVDAGTQERLFAVDLNSSRAAVATGAFGTILRSDDGGEHWRKVDVNWADYTETGQEPHLYAAHVAEDGTLTVAGEFGLILRSTDDGRSWKTLHRGDASIFDVALHGDGGASYAVGQVGTVLRSDDGGKTWHALASGSGANLLAVTALPGGDVFVAGFRETLVGRSGGESWQTFADERMGTLWFSGAAASGETVLAVGQAGQVLRLRP